MSAAIPDRLAAITPAWLTEVAALRWPGAVAEAVEIADAHSGTTGRARLRIHWRSGVEAPGTLFAKLPPSDPTQREMVISVGMGRREARFYGELAEGLPLRVPQPFWTGWNESGSAYFMLLEDLAASGCQLHDLASQHHDSATHARGMMATLARLHGRHWDTPRFGSDLAWIAPAPRSEIGPRLVHEALRLFAERMPDAFRDLGDLYVHHTEDVNDLLEQGTPTLVHGDCHVGNTFTDGAEVGLLDWALVCRAPALRDVAYYLCNSIPIEERRAHGDALLEHYLTALEAAGGEAPAPDVARAELARQALHSWVAVAVTAAAGARMQSIEAGELSMQRATAAIVDLDTPHALRSALGR